MRAKPKQTTLDRVRPKRPPPRRIDWVLTTRVGVTFSVIVMFYVLTFIIFNLGKYDMPEWLQALINIAFGAAATKYGDAVGYWLNTSQSSADKNAMIKGK